jgi:hypothetical protein
MMMPADTVTSRPYVDVTAAMAEQPRQRAIRLEPVSADPFAEVEV